MAKSNTAVATKSKASTAVAPGGLSAEEIAAKVQEELSRISGATARAGGDVIRCTQDKKFVLPGGSPQHGPLNLIIVDFISTNALYEGAFNPNDVQPPICYAANKTIADMTPLDASPQRQCDSCGLCPMNQFGSDGNGKACKNHRLLAVLPADFDEDSEIMVLKVSPTALKNFDGYANNLAAKKILPWMVETVVDFDDSVTYARLTFNDPQPLDPERAAQVYAMKEKAITRLMQAPDFTPRVAVKPAAPARRGAAPARGARR